MHDVAVAGGGIVGLATARALALRGMSVVVLEREDRLGAHQTTHNSGVIHAGIYYAPGSLKARLCVEGAAALYEYCAAHGIAAERCGKLVIAVREADLERLDELERRARANGVEGLARLGPDEIAAIEPAARGLSALHSPNTGMVDFGAVAAAYADDVASARRRDPDRRRRAGARRARRRRRASWGRGVRARHAVACAGAWSDRLALASGARPDVRIVPFRGAYLRLLRPELVRGQIYPVPDPALPFLGVHLSRTIDGEVLVGPTALLAPARDAYRSPRPRADLARRCAGRARRGVIRRWWRTGLRELAPRRQPPPAGARGRPLRARHRAGRRAARPRGHPRPGGRPRRHAGRRLQARPHRAGRPRPQRAVAGRHGLARDRGADRERGDVNLRPPRGPRPPGTRDLGARRSASR